VGWEAWTTLGLIVFLVGAMALTRISADVILWGGVSLLLVLGILEPHDALGGLAKEGMVTVGVLYIVVAGIRATGGMAWVVQTLLGRPRSILGAQARLMGPVAAASAFLNNTPLVAMMIPAVTEWAKNLRLPASKLMIPLSYAAIFGGVCTLIGTSTNLVVYGLVLSETDMPPLGMFTITWVGVPCAIAGIAYMLLFSRWLLPDRQPAISTTDDPRQYTVEMIVEANGPMVGKTIEQAGLRHLSGLYLMEIEREGEVRPAVAPEETLQANDRLVFVGIVGSVVELHKMRGLKPATDQVFKLDAPRSQRCLLEAVVSDSCPLAGVSVREGRFRTVYNAVVIAVARNGERLREKIGDIVLKPGDTLLLEALPSFVAQHRDSRDFYLVSRIPGSELPRYEKSWVALLILFGMVAVVTAGWLSMLKGALLAAGLMLITRCCRVSEARRGVDWHVLLVIAAAFALGAALDKTGAAAAIAGGLVDLAGGHPWLTLAMVYAATTIFTEIITNNAAAILVFPIALAVSKDLGVNFMPFVAAIMVGASASFSTPIGYQTNMMVYGPGGYRFLDYPRVGLPLNVVIGVVTVLLAPLVWPF